MSETPGAAAAVPSAAGPDEAPAGSPAGPADGSGPLPEPVPHDLSHRVRGLGCPNCGGPLEVASGLRVVTCPWCATTLLAVSEIGIRRWAVEPQVDSAKAREIARGWLARGVSKDPRLKKEAEIGEAFLTFLPFYRVEADCVGIALGTEERRRTVGSGKNRRVQTYEVDVERRAEKSFDRTYPALNVAEWGIQRVDLRGDPLVPFEAGLLERLGMVFQPTGSESELRRHAVASFRREADPSRGLKRVRFKFLESLRERLSVVYYPLWVVRYRFRGRGYQVLVDGEDGSLGYGKAPGNDFYRAAMLVATEAAAAFLFTTAVQIAPGEFAFFFGGAVALALVWWGWRKFRYGGVVIEGTGADKDPGLGRALRDAARTSAPGNVVRHLLSGR